MIKARNLPHTVAFWESVFGWACAHWRPFALAMAATLYPACGARESASEPIGQVASADNTQLQDSNDFSDSANPSWSLVQYYSTIRYPDVNGDRASDVCGRYADGVHCAVDDGTGTGTLINDGLWQSAFSDAAGWNQPQYYATISFADVNGDGKADLCGRGTAGVNCALSTGTSFGAVSVWSTAFSDAAGWDQPEYYSTIQLNDVNGDGKADVCGRGISGVYCALSNGKSFSTATLWQTSATAFSDAAGWNQVQYFSTIRLADVNHDGKADVCGRGISGIWCGLSTGTGFANSASLWQTDSATAFSDANGWNGPIYYSTIQFDDVNDDGKVDVCGRGPTGNVECGLSTGTSFDAATVWSTAFSDSSWNQPQYYSTIRIVGGVLCGRGFLGLYCQYANTDWAPAQFAYAYASDGPPGLFPVPPDPISTNESDAAGWTLPQYYATIGLAPDHKLLERGSAGIYSTQAIPKDQVSITTSAQLNAKRSALINHIWGTTTLDTTTTNVVLSTPPVDVAGLPAGTTVTRYTVNMPTSGQSPSADGTAQVEGIVDHYIPSGGSTKLAIINPGHTCSYSNLASGTPPTQDSEFQDSHTVDALLADGYAVLAAYMPEYTPVNCVGVYGHVATPNAVFHDVLFEPGYRPAGGLHPLVYFLDPVRRSLNYALQHYSYSQVFMTGLSGGGWTTTLYAALDTRITLSVPVAGSVPFYMRYPAHRPNLVGDSEQDQTAGATSTSGNDFFAFGTGSGKTVTGYQDLYILGASGAGRRQIQVLNRNDDCCFGEEWYIGGSVTWQEAARAYEARVRQQLRTLGSGSYRLEINEADDCNLPNNCPAGVNCGCGQALGEPGAPPVPTAYFKHEFSGNTRFGVILAEFNGAVPFVGAASGGNPFGRAADGNLSEGNGPGKSWTDLGFAMVGTPAIVQGALNKVDAFYRDPSNNLVHAVYGTKWSAAGDVSGTVISDPTALSWKSGRIDVFAVGPDYQVHHWTVTASGAQPETIGANGQYAVGPPAATSWGSSRLDVLYRGYSDSALHHAYTATGAAPYTVEATGQTIKNFPAALSGSASSKTIYAFVDTAADNLFEGQQTAGGAWSFSNLTSAAKASGSAPMLGAPGAALTSSGAQFVAMRCDGNATNQVGTYTDSSSWQFAPNGGGPFIGSPMATTSDVYMLDASQAVWQHTSSGWQSLGTFIER